jgi:hypothetical protein
MYLIIPELSLLSEPPYNPFESEAGMPSICFSAASADISALPRIITPPQ